MSYTFPLCLLVFPTQTQSEPTKTVKATLTCIFTHADLLLKRIIETFS